MCTQWTYACTITVSVGGFHNVPNGNIIEGSLGFGEEVMETIFLLCQVTQ